VGETTTRHVRTKQIDQIPFRTYENTRSIKSNLYMKTNYILPTH